jgi:NADPH:quinone reductase
MTTGGQDMATTTARTVIIERPGGPEEMKVVERPVGDPGPGEIRIRHAVCGLNFIDVYQRSGLYKLEMPHALGMEAAGVVEAVGAGVTHLKEGDRAAYAAMPPGAYSEARVMPAAQVCPLPDGISFEEGAAAMLQGMTVEYLFHRVAPIAKGERVLFHAAAGGVGLIACQWAKSEGIELIGTAGPREMPPRGRGRGGPCHRLPGRGFRGAGQGDHRRQGRGLRDGRRGARHLRGLARLPVAARLDDLLRQRLGSGRAGQPLTLAAKGSLKLTRTTLFTFLADHARCQEMARHLFDKMLSGAVRMNIGQRYPLERIAEAHRALEARETTGTTIITL